MPFLHSVPPEKRYPTIKAQLRNPRIGGPAILAWAIQACLDWQQWPAPKNLIQLV